MDEEDGDYFDEESDVLISCCRAGPLPFFLRAALRRLYCRGRQRGPFGRSSFCPSLWLLGSVCYHHQRWWMYAISGVLLLMALVYTIQVWHMVPFAATNLKVVIRGMTVRTLSPSSFRAKRSSGWSCVANGVYELGEVYGTHSSVRRW